MTIKTKIWLNILLVVFVSVLLGYIGFSNMQAIDTSYRDLWNVNGKTFIHLGKTQATFHQYRLNLRTLVLLEDSKEAEATLKKLETRLAENVEAMKLVEKNVTGEDEKKIFGEMKALFDTGWKANAEVLALARAGRRKEATALLLGDCEKKAQNAKNKLEELISTMTSNGDIVAASNAKTTVGTGTQFIYLTGTIAIFSIVFGAMIIRSTSRAIDSIVRECSRLTAAAVDGKFDVRGDVGAMSVEFKPVIEGVNKTLDNVVEKIFWFEQLLDSMPVPISVTDKESRWTFFNKSVEQFLGVSRKDMIGFSSSEEGISRTLAETTRKIYQVDNYSLYDIRGEKQGNIELLFDVTARTRGCEYLKREIDRISGSLSQIAAGDFNISDTVEEPDQYTQNEYELFIWLNVSLFDVRNAILRLSSDTRELIRAALDGKLEVRAAEDAHNGEFKKIINGINSTLDAAINPVKEAVRCLREMSAGNLDVEMKGEYKGDHAVIKDALNGTLRSLNELLSQVAHAVDQVNIGSRQVSDASQSLSHGAATSASSLEEISASMRQINFQTRQNAENAAQADKLAKETSVTAQGGYAQVNDMTTAMHEINEAASSVSKIIKSIDEIAFQTNLLALNAAVEAARAGKHGKGFTVVAEEVRNLAQRSARAAKETAEMIENSIKKAEAGTVIAVGASKALNEIVGRVTRVTDLVGEIAASSKEQAQGIVQVDQGIAQVDQITQQNTATAEQSAAASEELSSQAQELRAMLAKFKLKAARAAVVNAYIEDERAADRSAGRVRASVTTPAGGAVQGGRTAVTPKASGAVSPHGPVSKKTPAAPVAKPAIRQTKNSSGVAPEDIISLDDSEFGKF